MASDSKSKNEKKIAPYGLYMTYIEEISLRGRLNEYSAFYFNIEGLREISEQHGLIESRKVSKKYEEQLCSFLNNDEFIGFLGDNNYAALIKKHRTNTFRKFISSIDLETVLNGKILSHHLEAACGIWEMNEDVHDLREVVNNPALAFIEAKYVLRQQYMTLPSGQVSRANQQREIIEAFREAISRKEFKVYYQPKVDINTNRVIGAEGLVRWYRNKEIVSPTVFIRPFEQTGDILQLDYYVLRTICNDIKQWQKRGIQPVPISVNYSRKNLLDEDLAENINFIIQQSGIDKKYIELEIAEASDSEEFSFMSDFVHQLSGMGVKIAIDNFGSGYSSISALHDLPVKTIKIDRSFINTDDFSQKDEVIFSHIVNMAKELGITVITQGVEREDQLTFVKSAGCEVVQGYYFDRPLPREDFEERLSLISDKH